MYKKQIPDTTSAKAMRPNAVGSTAQPININPIIKDSKTIMVINTSTISQAEASGFEFAYSKGYNRAVKPAQVKKLMDSVKSIGRFLHPIKVISAKVYLGYYPDRELDCDGKKIDHSSPNLDRILVLLDGQHRFSAYKELKASGTQADLPVDFVDLYNIQPDKWIEVTNTTSQNWTCNDRVDHIVTRINDSSAIITIAKEWRDRYGMSLRNAFAILTFKDCYKKSLLEENMDASPDRLNPLLKGSPAKVERGRKLLNAFQIGFRHSPKMLGNMAAIKLAIEKYDEADDAEKAMAVDKILLFFKSLDQEVAKRANSTSSVTKKQDVLQQEWERLSQELNSEEGRKELEQLAMAAKSEFEQLQAKDDKTDKGKASAKVSKIQPTIAEKSSVAGQIPSTYPAAANAPGLTEKETEDTPVE